MLSCPSSRLNSTESYRTPSHGLGWTGGSQARTAASACGRRGHRPALRGGRGGGHPRPWDGLGERLTVRVAAQPGSSSLKWGCTSPSAPPPEALAKPKARELELSRFSPSHTLGHANSLACTPACPAAHISARWQHSQYPAFDFKRSLTERCLVL